MHTIDRTHSEFCLIDVHAELTVVAMVRLSALSFCCHYLVRSHRSALLLFLCVSVILLSPVDSDSSGIAEQRRRPSNQQRISRPESRRVHCHPIHACGALAWPWCWRWRDRLDSIPHRSVRTASHCEPCGTDDQRTIRSSVAAAVVTGWGATGRREEMSG
jgi:hypothetical protein